MKGTVNRVVRIQEVNALVLYNLTPGGVCRFKNIQVCYERCPNAETLKFNSATSLAFSALISLGTLASLYI